MRLFGARAKGAAAPDSDLDLLVDRAPGRDLFDLIEMKQDREAVTGLRDVLGHDYFGIDLDTVRLTVENRFPALKLHIRNLL